VVENLTDIRTRTKQKGRQSRRRLHSWSFAQMRAFLTYKAEAKGCQVVGVDPRHTSQMCSRCGHVHRGNRKSQSVFLCKECGYELNADLNGAKNIAAKYLASVGISDAGGPLSDGPLSQTPVPANVPAPQGERQDLSATVVSWPENHTDAASGAEIGLETSPRL
jgi:transposase